MLTELFEKELFMSIKMDLALNNLQWLICHKTKPNQTKPNQNDANLLTQPGSKMSSKVDKSI